jgi:nucleosome assembly protein 1-like 1
MFQIVEISETTIDNEQIKGIPDFWLTILKNTSLISDMIQPHDEPILSHLTDIKVYLLDEPMVIHIPFFI